MYYWITLIIGGPCFTFLTLLLWGLMLKPRWTRLPRWVPPLIYTIAILPTLYFRADQAENQLLFQLLELIQIVGVIIFLMVVFRDALWRKLLAVLLIYSMAHIGQEITLPLMSAAGIYYSTDFSTQDMFYFNTMGCIINLCLFAIATFAWRRIFHKEEQAKNTWIFLLFPISQIFLLWSAQKKFIDGKYVYSGNVFVVIGALIGFLADIILLYVVLTLEEKEGIANRLRETEYLRKVEEVHYQSIEMRHEEIAKIRHDFNNQLTTALHLVQQGDSNLAHTQLEQLQTQLLLTRESEWCSNPVVNAVVAEKVKACKEGNISIDVEVAVDSTCSIEPIKLCSLFSNLLDNAIAAAKEYNGDQKFIRLHSMQNGDYLHIKVENSSSEPTGIKKVAKGHGYGQQIIRDIAAVYQGELYTDWKDGVYTAMVSLEEQTKFQD